MAKSLIFRKSIRFKLLLVSLTLLTLPWAGYQFIQETEAFLRDAQDQNLFITANAIGTLIQNHDESFQQTARHKITSSQPDSKQNLYLHALTHQPVIDGYRDEWERWQDNFSLLKEPHSDYFATLFLGTYQSHLYLLIGVNDNNVTYGKLGDSIELAMIDAKRKTRRFRIQPHSPGWVSAQSLLLTTSGLKTSDIEPRIRGEWQETGSGYTLELKIPIDLVARRFSIKINNGLTTETLMNAPLTPANEIGYLVRASSGLEKVLKKLAPENTRLWITDSSGLVLAKAGVLDTDAVLSQEMQQLPWIARQIVLSVIPQTVDDVAALSDQQTVLSIPSVEAALQGNSKAYRRKVPEKDSVVVSAAIPIHSNGQVVGTVMIEQTTNAILSIQNLTLQRLFGITLALFFIVGVVLLGFSSLLVARIRRLRNALENAVSHDGRIVSQIKASDARDEIGDLSRSFASVLERLNDYNHYLEAMASRLAHEMRTPLTVVHTSLENARHTQNSEQLTYLSRAENGIERLQNILARLREATRLEQTLNHSEKEVFELGSLLKNQIENYRTIHSDIIFNLVLPENNCKIMGVPDLLYQALEKLLSNAIDFHKSDTPISIELSKEDSDVIIKITNIGSELPDNIDIFQSMISIRKKQSEEPHLGLGLYLVRLIVEFHQGTVSAHNNDANHVEFLIRLPI